MRLPVRYRLFLLAAVLGAGLCAPVSQAAEPEYKVKAAFTYKIANYVSWPGQGAPKNKNMCLLGKMDAAAQADFSGFLQSIPENQGRPRVLIKNSVEEAADCHVLFIAGSEESHLAEIMHELQGKPILTLSDMRDFARRGGMVEFIIASNTIKIIVNKLSINSARLTIDPQLLDVALSVIK